MVAFLPPSVSPTTNTEFVVTFFKSIWMLVCVAKTFVSVDFTRGLMESNSFNFVTLQF